MRLALAILTLITPGGAAVALLLLEPREPDYGVGAERMYNDVIGRRQ